MLVHKLTDALFKILTLKNNYFNGLLKINTPVW